MALAGLALICVIGINARSNSPNPAQPTQAAVAVAILVPTVPPTVIPTSVPALPPTVAPTLGPVALTYKGL